MSLVIGVFGFLIVIELMGIGKSINSLERTIREKKF